MHRQWSCSTCTSNHHTLSQRIELNCLAPSIDGGSTCDRIDRRTATDSCYITQPLALNQVSRHDGGACEHCGYQTNNKSSLTRHLRLHTGEKPYVCEHCGYSASQKVHLMTHLRVHTGEKPYACEHCAYRTSDKSSLTTHVWVHTGEQPYACEHCEYRTGTKSHLVRHMRVHTG